jgi:hypothetical protein
MLFRWFNFHLANADSPRTLSNWSRDLQVRRECVLCVCVVRVSCVACGQTGRPPLPSQFM